jgi:aminoglycoside/choline kinase family phosphotransferase
MKNLKKIKGDASFRKFYRKKSKKANSIIVLAKKEKIKNLIIYEAINRILNKNKILAPKLIKENYKKNYIEIQDFGDYTIFKILKGKKVNKFLYFKKIIDLMTRIQLIKNRSIKNFRNKIYHIPKYNKKILINEANLFSEWYAEENLKNSKKKTFSKKFNKVIKELISKLSLKNNVFVHRDFHVSNLMLVRNEIGVIDSQDALIGNKAYDLASLIDDVRFKTSKSFKKKVYDHYLKKQKNLIKNKFKNDFEILSVLRNLKIIGIFTRLSLRDGKKKYIKLIPYTWELINMRIKENKVFFNLKSLLSQNFEKKIK